MKFKITLKKELGHWKYYFAPYIGTGAYLLLTNVPTSDAIRINWHIWNAIGLAVGYILTFALRKYWFGSKGFHKIHTELTKYTLWFTFFFFVSIGGAYVLIEYFYCPYFWAQVVMSVVTSIMGRAVAPTIFSSGLKRL